MVFIFKFYRRLTPLIAGRKLCCATTPWTDSSPSLSLPLVSLLLGIRLITQRVQLRNACRAWNVAAFNDTQLWIVQAFFTWSHWSKSLGQPSGADDVSTTVLPLLFLPCTYGMYFPWNCYLTYLFKSYLLYLFIHIYWNQIVFISMSLFLTA